MILRRIARPMLAAVFVSGGIATLRDPKPHVQAAEPVAEKAPVDAETMVKLNAYAQIGAGVAFALGKWPRLAALVLAGTLVPTTAAENRFWEEEHPGERATQQNQFIKNVSLLGGLLIAAADTHGKPSVAWRARRVTAATKHTARGTAAAAKGTVLGTAATAKGSVRDTAATAKDAARNTAITAKDVVRNAAVTAKNTARSTAVATRNAARTAAKD